MGSHVSVWGCREPSQWPTPPDEMTYSTLNAIEICPRRWALQVANYPELWGANGYPPKIAIKGLSGTIVHSVVETLTRELVRAGCGSVTDASAIDVMRLLGGYTGLITRSIETTLDRCKKNPRALKFQEQLERSLHEKVPEIRRQIQGLLAHVHLQTKSVPRRVGPGQARGQGGPLRPGIYAELTLRAKSIHWKGRADLLGLDDQGCEIVDFKTGERRDEHPLQVLIYALLWWLDGELNPRGGQATKLTVAYPDGNVDVPAPTKQQLETLMGDIRHRTAIAVENARMQPPPARPTPEGCRFCSVKQLCQEYWKLDVQRRIQPSAGAIGFADVQAVITSRHGATSWDATIEVAGDIASGTAILIRTTSSDYNLRVGSRIRIIDVWFGANSEGADVVKVATVGIQSEVYVLE